MMGFAIVLLLIASIFIVGKATVKPEEKGFDPWDYANPFDGKEQIDGGSLSQAMADYNAGKITAIEFGMVRALMGEVRERK